MKTTNGMNNVIIQNVRLIIYYYQHKMEVKLNKQTEAYIQ